MYLDDLEIYELALKLGDHIWRIVIKWDFFAKDTIGKQWIRAADSVPANISEGYGRFHFKEEKHFFYYARGSLYETRTFIKIAYQRNLIPEDKYLQLVCDVNLLGKKLNRFISSIGSKKKSS